MYSTPGHMVDASEFIYIGILLHKYTLSNFGIWNTRGTFVGGIYIWQWHGKLKLQLVAFY